MYISEAILASRSAKVRGASQISVFPHALHFRTLTRFIISLSTMKAFVVILPLLALMSAAALAAPSGELCLLGKVSGVDLHFSAGSIVILNQRCLYGLTGLVSLPCRNILLHLYTTLLHRLRSDSRITLLPCLYITTVCLRVLHVTWCAWQPARDSIIRVRLCLVGHRTSPV
jgi:hypothetical protein